jgi:hypothetical protein
MRRILISLRLYILKCSRSNSYWWLKVSKNKHARSAILQGTCGVIRNMGHLTIRNKAMERCPHKLTQSFIMQESGLGLLLLLHHLQVLGRLVEAEGGQGRGGAPPSPSWCAYRLARSDSLSLPHWYKLMLEALLNLILTGNETDLHRNFLFLFYWFNPNIPCECNVSERF